MAEYFPREGRRETRKRDTHTRGTRVEKNKTDGRDTKTRGGGHREDEKKRGKTKKEVRETKERKRKNFSPFCEPGLSDTENTAERRGKPPPAALRTDKTLFYIEIETRDTPAYSVMAH